MGGVDCVGWVGLMHCSDGWDRLIGLGIIECCGLVGFRSCWVGYAKCC